MEVVSPPIELDRAGACPADAAAFDLALEHVRLRAIAALHPSAPAADELPAVEARLTAAPWPARDHLRQLGVDDDELALLLFVAAWRADPLLTPHLPALAAEPQRGATFAAFARVVAWPPGRTRALSHRVLRTTSSLRALRLVVADERAPSPLTPLRVPHRVIDFLAGVPSIDAAISAVGGAVTAPLAPALDPAHQAALERLSQAMSAPAPIIAVLEGPEGSGRRALAALAAARLQRQVVHVDLGRLARGADLGELFTALARERLLANAVPMLVGVETSRGEDAEARARRAAIAALASQLDGPMVLASTEVGVGVESTRPVLRLALPCPIPPRGGRCGARRSAPTRRPTTRSRRSRCAFTSRRQASTAPPPRRASSRIRAASRCAPPTSPRVCAPASPSGSAAWRRASSRSTTGPTSSCPPTPAPSWTR